MKRLAALLCAAALILSLSACGAGAASSETVSSASASADGSGAASSETVSRSEHSTIIMDIEGDTEEVPATLYQGEGYTIYIPDEGWTQVAFLEGGTPDCWQADDNDEVKLKIHPYADMQQAQVQQAFQRQEDDYTFTLEDFKLVGRDEENQKTMTCRFYRKETTAYCVAMECPDDSAEGFGARLAAIAATFKAD